MIADTIPHAAGLPAARLLARRLLNGYANPSDDQIADAFRAYLQLLQAGNEQAIEASRELDRWHQSPNPTPYFLEVLEARARLVERKKSGTYYTPWPVAQWMVRRVEQLVPAGPLRIVDPACGGGVFLLAAADLASRRPGTELIGYDTSAAAIAVAGEVLRSVTASATLEQINPLLAGQELKSELLSGERTLVILGNPPYANFGRRNRGPWIDALVAVYRDGVDEQKLNLTDDFIKFLRWGQHWIDQAGRGVLAMITSRTYLSGLTHRGMRRSLVQSFPHIEIVDLHGDGEAGDANIFGIRRGVSIAIFGKQYRSKSGHVQYHSVAGSRAKKLRWLRQPTPAKSRFKPRPPDCLFVPGQERAKQAASDFLSWPRLDQIFSEFVSGVQTKNDRLFVDFDRDVLAARMKQHLAHRGELFDATCLRPYVVGPFDRRWIYYDPRLLGRARWQVMRHMVQVEGNIALVFMRQSTATEAYDHALVVDTLASDRVFYSRRGAPFVAPLWQISDPSQDGSPNFNRNWMDGMQERLGSRIEPASLFAYIYAVLHSPHYRSAYLALLQRDFPHIPWPESSSSFQSITAIGKRLIGCHLGTESNNPSSPVDCVGTSLYTVARGYPQLDGDTLWLNCDSGLRLPDAESVRFRVGGHAVLQRWLQVRRGQALSAENLEYIAWLHNVAITSSRLAEQLDQISSTTPTYRLVPTAAP